MMRALLAGMACFTLLATGAEAQQNAPAPQAVQNPSAHAPAVSSAVRQDGLRKRAWDKIAGNWKRFKGSVQERWGRLTHDEIAQAHGHREALNGFIQSRYGIDRDAADRQIDEWLETLPAK